MAARAGMAAVLAELRDMADVGTTDYTVNSVAYFSDDQLQTYVDRTMLITRMMPMQPIPVRVGATTQWFDYQIADDLGIWFEQYTGPTDGSGWAVKDGNGNTKTIGVDYNINYNSAVVTFLNDTMGQAYLLDCHSYDLNSAAAAVWRKKAAFEHRSVDFKSDNHDVKSESRYKHCLQMAEYYEQKSGVSGDGGIGTASFRRTDENLAEPNYAQGTQSQNGMLAEPDIMPDSETSLLS